MACQRNFFFPTGSGFQQAQEMDHDKTFQGKRGKTEKAQDRHFEKFYLSHERDSVDPFGQGPEIPEFPKQSADHAGQ